MELIDGIGLVPVVMGLFGIAEVLLNTEQVIKRDIINTKITHLLPSKEDWKASAGPMARGTVLGFFLGILPGGGAVISSFASYALEKRLSKTPGTVRQRRDRGRGGAGSRQQRRSRRRLHSADDARHSAECGDGAAARRLRHSRAAARPADDHAEPRPVLGHRRQHVYRQSDAAGAQLCR